VLSHVGQGFLDQPEELERGQRGELVGRRIGAQARGNLVPLFKLVQVLLEGVDQSMFPHVGAEPGNGLADILVDLVGDAAQVLQLGFRLLWSAGAHQPLDGVQAQQQLGDKLGRTRSCSTALMVRMSRSRATASAWSRCRTANRRWTNR
jgi:hypothetical protein